MRTKVWLFPINFFVDIFEVLIAALSDIFEKFDISGDGTISIQEYKTLCEEYGVPLTEDDIVAIRDIADADGEVLDDDDDDFDIFKLLSSRFTKMPSFFTSNNATS